MKLIHSHSGSFSIKYSLELKVFIMVFLQLLVAHLSNRAKVLEPIQLLISLLCSSVFSITMIP
jgi:hypothetical protein